MGFWSSFFGHAAANAISDAERENKKYNELCREIDDYQDEMDDYLNRIGCDAGYFVHYEAVKTGSLASEKRRMENTKKRIEEYIQYGGDPHYVHDLDEIDDNIEKVKYLKNKNMLNRQEKFDYYDYESVKAQIESEGKNEYSSFSSSSINSTANSNGSPVIYDNINDLSGIEFEKLCQSLIDNMGFETKTTKASGDGGIDLIAYNHQPILSGTYIIQCKRYSGSVGEPIIRDLYGVITSERANKGILITTGYFTKSAISFAEGKPIELIDGEKLDVLLKEYGFISYDINKELSSVLTPEEVFEKNFIEEKYDRYAEYINSLTDSSDDQERAEFINWLMELTMTSEGSDEIYELDDKLVIWIELKKQIKEYLNHKRKDNSKYLAYIYQMVYIEICIFEGDFNDAQNMFGQLIKNEDLVFNVAEALEPQKTADIFYHHTAIFSCLCHTWYNLVQVSFLLEDINYHNYLVNNKAKFYGLLELEKDRLERILEEMDSGLRYDGNKIYMQNSLAGFKDIANDMSLDFNVNRINHLFYINEEIAKMYFDYTYYGYSVDDVLFDIKTLSLKDDCLDINWIGKIKHISSKINAWNRFLY